MASSSGDGSGNGSSSRYIPPNARLTSPESTSTSTNITPTTTTSEPPTRSLEQLALAQDESGQLQSQRSYERGRGRGRGGGGGYDRGRGQGRGRGQDRGRGYGRASGWSRQRGRGGVNHLPRREGEVSIQEIGRYFWPGDGDVEAGYGEDRKDAGELSAGAKKDDAPGGGEILAASTTGNMNAESTVTAAETAGTLDEKSTNTGDKAVKETDGGNTTADDKTTDITTTTDAERAGEPVTGTIITAGMTISAVKTEDTAAQTTATEDITSTATKAEEIATQAATGDKSPTAPSSSTPNWQHSTLNASHDHPGQLAFLLLFANAHPRWENEGIVFAHTRIEILPGYEDALAKEREEKKRMKLARQAQRENVTSEGEEVKDTAVIGEEDVSEDEQEPAIPTTEKMSMKEFVSAAVSAAIASASSLGNQLKGSKTEAEDTTKESTSESTSAGGDSKEHTEPLASDSETTAPSEPLLNHSIAVFTQTNGSGGFSHARSSFFHFEGWYTLLNVDFLAPRSPELARMMAQKWESKDSSGRAKNVLREKEAWNKSMNQRWAVCRFKRCKIQDEAPVIETTELKKWNKDTAEKKQNGQNNDDKTDGKTDTKDNTKNDAKKESLSAVETARATYSARVKADDASRAMEASQASDTVPAIELLETHIERKREDTE